MYSVGSGMVLAIGDLAGATVVTLLAGTATQFARRVAYGPMALAIDDPPWRRSWRL
jgi:hypothetical protein